MPLEQKDRLNLDLSFVRERFCAISASIDAMDRFFLSVIGDIAEPLRELVQGEQPVIRWRWAAAVVIDPWVEVALLEEAL